MMLVRLLLRVLVPLIYGAAATDTAAAAAAADSTIVTTISSPSSMSSSMSTSTSTSTTIKMLLRGGEQQQQQQQHHYNTHRLLATAYNDDANDSSETATAAMDSAKEYVNTFQQNIQNIISTHPKEWTTNEILIVSAIIASFWTILILLVCCVRRRCCCNKNTRRRDENGDDIYTNTEKKKFVVHEMTRPYVKRIGAGSVLTSNSSFSPPLTYGNLDATDITKLPLGVRLHGAVQLRRNNLEGQDIRIAVIDSGIDSSHPGFHGSIYSEKYWFRHGTPLSKDDHGTHVAGTIHFMAPQAEIYDYRVFGEDGDMDGNTAVAKSIRHAVDLTKCHIINMSLSVGYPVRADVQKAIQYAYKKGVHMVCAAGNDGDGNPTTDEIYCYPAIYKETISIAAVHKEDGFLLDATNFSESNSSINYSGIGSNVVSLKPGGGIQTMSGTSMAAPHVTGLIACLLSSNNPTKYNTHKKLRALLDTTYVIDIGEEGYDKQTGKGFLSYLAANDKDDFIDLLSMVAN